MAEKLAQNDQISKAVQDGSSWVLQKTKEEPIVGISRIWVAQDCRRQGVASKLVRAMETNFYPQVLRKGKDFAFSHTTPDGSLFASKHTGKNFFLTYSYDDTLKN